MEAVYRFNPVFSVLLILLSTFLLFSFFTTKSSIKNEHAALAIPNQFQPNDNTTVPLETINHPPVAIAVLSQTVNENSTATLTGHAEDQDKGNTLSFLWEQTDGPAVNLSNRTSPTPAFTAPKVPSDTELKFSLTVTDDQGASSPPFGVSVMIKHINSPPIASAGQNQTVNEGYVATLDGTRSKDPDGDPITYSWMQTGGQPVKLNHADKASTTFTAPTDSTIANKSSESELVFKLTVTDNKNTANSDYIKVIVRHVPLLNKSPVANAGDDQVADSGTAVILNGTNSKDPEGGPLKYSWVQTTGTPLVILNDNDKTKATFTAPAVSSDTIYTFKLAVSDEDGSLAYDDVKVTVKQVAPISNSTETLNLIYSTKFIPEGVRLANLKSFTHSVTVWINSTVPVLYNIKDVTYITEEGFTTLAGGQTESVSPVDKFRVSFNALDGFQLDARVNFKDGHLRNLTTKIVLR